MSGKFILYAVIVSLVSTGYNWSKLLSPSSNTGGTGSSWSSGSRGSSWGGGGGHK